MDLMEKLVSLSKRRGFVYPSSEIYGGFANSYTYGPYGAQLKKNIKDLWWTTFVTSREDMVGLDGPILLHPKTWETSGHTTGFNDALVDCKNCKNRFRADHLVEEKTGEDLEGQIEEMNKIVHDQIDCPECGKRDWTNVRTFNLMFQTSMANVSDGDDAIAYLRPETAQAIFLEFKNVLDSMRVKLPFGIAQIGKAFRNEIVAGNFIFRLREFEQMEIEYFIHPNADWNQLFEDWLVKQEEFAMALGAKKEDLRRLEHDEEKLSHYSKKTIDIEYNYPFGGFKELFGLAYRTDYDLAAHMKASGEKLTYFDPATNEHVIPHVIEPTFGLDRSILLALLSAYDEEDVNGEMRVVMRFPKAIAPVQIAILPLSKKEELSTPAREIYNSLKGMYSCEYDETQSIGKRYRRQDEIGTPYCITIDFDSLEDNAVTIRDRDSMEQERIKMEELSSYFSEKFNS